MTVLLIANIGNRDVWVDKTAPIPGEVHPIWNKQASRRAMGKALQNNWSNCQTHLGLPIIGKAVEHVLHQEQRIDRIVLIASDQSGQETVSERYLAQDTCELAPVVERLLTEKHDLVGDAEIIHWSVKNNPADYGEMQAFFREHLTELHDNYGDGVFYLEVSGGTPAMTSMLLTVGAEVLGLDAHPLYVSEREEQAFPLDLGRRLVADSLLETIKANLDIYAYHAAANTVRSNLDLLQEFIPVESLLTMLEYAYRRRSFSFDEAWATLASITDLTWRKRANATAAGLREHERAWLLQEGIYNAQISFQLGRWFDFITRVFQFVEGALRLLSLELGVEFVKDERDQTPDEDGKRISQNWQQQHQPLVADMSQAGIDISYGANRPVLTAIVERLCVQQGDDARQVALDAIQKLETVADLRNRVVHRYHHITLELLRDTFYPKKRDRKHHPPEDAAEIVRTMEKVWQAVTDQPFDNINPYRAINQLVLDLLAD